MNLVVDVSDNNGTILWSLVPQNKIDGVWVKITQGISILDDMWDYNWMQAVRKWWVGAYHFAGRPAGNGLPAALANPVTEANWFLQNAPLATAKSVALDMEVFPSGVDVDSWALRWFAQVSSRYPTQWQYLYCSASKVSLFPQTLKKHPLWVADWVDEDPAWSQAPSFSTCNPSMWQYTSQGTLVGRSKFDFSLAPVLPNGSVQGDEEMTPDLVSAVVALAYRAIGVNPYPGTPHSVETQAFAHQVDAVLSGTTNLQTVVNNILNANPIQ